MTRPNPNLYLVTPVLEDATAFRPILEAACLSADVTALLLRLAPADERTLVNRVKELAAVAQRNDTAVILSDPGDSVDLGTLVTRGGADGAHSDSPARLRDLRARLRDGHSIGAGGLRSKHDAMVAGELGVDYVLFGEPRQDGSLPERSVVIERTAWWAEIFQMPCVVYGPTLDALPEFGATGAEFVALGAAVWTHPGGPAAALAEARRLLSWAEDMPA